MLKYERMTVGEMQTNCYLVWSTDKTAVIIDPGDEGVEIAQRINELQIRPMAILLTHGHFDHLLGVAELQLIFKIPVAMGKEDVFLVNRAGETATHFLKRKVVVPKIKNSKTGNIKNLKLGNEVIEIITTPGHTPGSVCFYAKESGLLFTGDTLFADGEGDDISHRYSTKIDLSKILNLPGETVVLPGHGEECFISSLSN